MRPDQGLGWLVYTSYATTRFDDARLAGLLRRSREENGRRGITGLLLYREQRFLQALEGPRSVVADLVARIGADGRHHALEVVVDEPAEHRRFPGWSMGYRPWSTPAHRLPTGFDDTFDGLARHPRDTAGPVRELLEWFRYRADVLDAVEP